MDEVKCQRCDHRYDAHRPKCHHEKIGAFDAETRHWGKRVKCTCEAYVGVKPDEMKVCPHDFIVGSPLCIYCNKPAKRRAPWPPPR